MDEIVIKRASNGWIIEEGGKKHVAKVAEDLASWVEEWADLVEKREQSVD